MARSPSTSSKNTAALVDIVMAVTMLRWNSEWAEMAAPKPAAAGERSRAELAATAEATAVAGAAWQTAGEDEYTHPLKAGASSDDVTIAGAHGAQSTSSVLNQYADWLVDCLDVYGDDYK